MADEEDEIINLANILLKTSLALNMEEALEKAKMMLEDKNKADNFFVETNKEASKEKTIEELMKEDEEK